jgi:hypothetical protein
MSLPLAVLAVAGASELRPGGWWRERARWVAVSLVLLLGIGVADRLDQVRREVHLGGQPYFLHQGEKDALAYLERLPRPGGVLAPNYAGLVVPYQTGRETWVGQISWTPDFHRRVARANALFAGRLRRAAAVRLVRRSAARFLFSDCLERADLSALLRPYLTSVRRFDCATVYQVDREAL